MHVLELIKNKNKTETESPDFDQNVFVPSVYNRTYHSTILEDEAALIEWEEGDLKVALRTHLFKSGKGHFKNYLDIGCGPTVHHAIMLGVYAEIVRLADFMPENLAEVKRWVRRDYRAHDWSHYTHAHLKAEGLDPSRANIRRRQNEIRSKIKSMYIVDLKEALEDHLVESADLVSAFFVSDSATRSKKVFEKMSLRAFKAVEPGGLYVSTYLGGCQRYRVGKKWINSANVTREDLEQVFTKCGATKYEIWRFETPAHKKDGYDHIFAAIAFKA